MVVAIFPFERGLAREATELSEVHDPIIRSLGSRLALKVIRRFRLPTDGGCVDQEPR